jgi:hypothetical protein
VTDRLIAEDLLLLPTDHDTGRVDLAGPFRRTTR